MYFARRSFVDSVHRTARNTAVRSISVEYVCCPAQRWSTIFTMLDQEDTKFRDPDTVKRKLFADNGVECTRFLHCGFWKNSDRPDVHKIVKKKFL
jgi:hypothetical protein